MSVGMRFGVHTFVFVRVHVLVDLVHASPALVRWEFRGTLVRAAVEGTEVLIDVSEQLATHTSTIIFSQSGIEVLTTDSSVSH
jgi:hypothetical protein